MDVVYSITGMYALFAFFLFLGIFASKIASWIKIPTLLMILLCGILLGATGLEYFKFDDYALAMKLGVLALSFILFSGGYDTSWSTIRKVTLPGTIISTFGVLVTALLTGAFACWLLDWDWRYGVLLGAVVSSTDAATVFSIFRSESTALKGNLQPILEYESGSNDPMAAFLTVFMIDMVISNASIWSMFYMFPLRIGVGAIVGFLVGYLVTRLMNLAKLDFDGLYYVIGIGTVFLTYSLSELCEGNGFMAVYVCGVTMGNSRFIYKHGLGRFHDGVAWLMQVMLFLTLGLLVNPLELPSILLFGTILVLFVSFISRPVSVFVSLLGSQFNLKEQLLIAWGGIRGAAPIVLAIFPCLAFQDDPIKMDIARDIFNIVFFMVIFSILVQGKTLMALAKWLKLGVATKTKSRPPLEFEETGISNSRMYEIPITEKSPSVGMTIKELQLPENVLVYLIRRDGVFILPRGGTMIQVDDELLMMMEPHLAASVEPLFLAQK